MIEKAKRMAWEKKKVLWIVRNDTEAWKLRKHLTKGEEENIIIKSIWYIARGYSVDMIILDEVDDLMEKTAYGEDYLGYLYTQMKKGGKLVQISTYEEREERK